MTPIEIMKQSTVLHTRDEINAAIDKLALVITQNHKNDRPILCCVLMGGVYTFGRLIPLLDFPLQIDTLRVGRYQNEKRSESLHWYHHPSINIMDRNIVLIDDIIDEGVTLCEIKNKLLESGAKSVTSAVLFDKQISNHQSRPLQADYSGLLITDHFVFGAGLDYSGYYRNLNELRCVSTRR